MSVEEAFGRWLAVAIEVSRRARGKDVLFRLSGMALGVPEGMKPRSRPFVLRAEEVLAQADLWNEKSGPASN